MIEQISDTTFDIPTLSGDKVEIGNLTSADFKPHLKLNRWGGECFINVGLPVIEKSLPIIDGDKITWEGHNRHILMYPLAPTKQFELGAYEYEIILDKKPKTNKIILDFNVQGLKLFYQPPLTSQEIEEGRFRPDNIVGSYAVYHATKGGLVTSQDVAKGITTGKAFHIPRPKIFDDRGDWVWGELYYDEKMGLLITTIPQEFLEYAHYPIRHAAGDTFGWTAGGGSEYVYSANQIWGVYPCIPSSSGTVEKITVRIGTLYGDKARPIIYKNGDDTLLSYGDEVSLVLESSNDLALTGSVVGSTEYILCVWSNDNIRLFYDSHATYKTAKEGETYHAINAPPSPCGWDGGKPAYNEWLDIYCTYTPAAAGWAGGDVNGVAIAAIAKINGIALADIAKVNGIA